MYNVILQGHKRISLCGFVTHVAVGRHLAGGLGHGASWVVPSYPDTPTLTTPRQVTNQCARWKRISQSTPLKDCYAAMIGWNSDAQVIRYAQHQHSPELSKNYELSPLQTILSNH